MELCSFVVSTPSSNSFAYRSPMFSSDLDRFGMIRCLSQNTFQAWRRKCQRFFVSCVFSFSTSVYQDFRLVILRMIIFVMSYQLRCSELKPGPGDGDGLRMRFLGHSSARSMTSYAMHWLFSKTWFYLWDTMLGHNF